MFTPDTPNFQSLMLMLDAAHMGWWKADFQAGELHVSEYIAKLLGLDGDKVRIGQLTHLVREDYRMPIHNEFMALKVDSKFDRTFPIELPEGEVWLHAQLVGRQTDPATGTHLFGYMQRVPVHDRREAEILTLENNYHTVVKENKHMDVLLDHLPIGYFRIRLLGLDGDKVRIGQLTHLVREDYRMPIHNEFMALKVDSKFDRTFPIELPEGEVWLHAQLVGRQTDPATGTHLFGYMQRVPVHDRREAEILTLENNYHTVVKENKHMDVLLDHLPIGYFRIRLLYDSDGRAIDYLFLSVNRAAQQIVGIEPDAYIGKTARETGHPVDAHIDKLAHIRLGNYKTDEWFAKKTRRHCRSFLYNTPNDGSEIVILILDITDAITAHKALDEQEKLLRNIIQNAPVGIEIYNDRGRLIDINTCDLEMFGVKDPGKIRGLNLFDNPNFPEETKIRI